MYWCKRRRYIDMNENNDYKIAYSQVLEIIKYLPVNYYERIPEKIIDMFIY